MFKIIKKSGDRQGEELFEIEFQNGAKQLINTWDYVSLYKYPHLYKMIYCDLLKCTVYDAIWELLSETMSFMDKLRILDVACGSGLMGKYLKDRTPIETELLVGVDILPEAIDALNRDNPHIYDYALVSTNNNMEELRAYDFNCMTVSAAANFMNQDDYKNYVSLLSQNAFIAFDLTDDEGDRRRMKILDWMNINFHFYGSKLYDHRELMNGSVIQHEVFLYKKGG